MQELCTKLKLEDTVDSKRVYKPTGAVKCKHESSNSVTEIAERAKYVGKAAK